MFGSTGRLFVHGVALDRWCARWGLEVFSHPCFTCGRMLTATRPFAQGALRGIQAPPCECGNARTPFELVRDPRYGDLFTGRDR